MPARAPALLLAGELAEKFLLVHAVLKRLAAVDEDYRNFVGVEAADFGAGVDVDFAPVEAASLVQLGEALFHNFAEVASFTGVNDHLANLRHRAECSSFGAGGRDAIGPADEGTDHAPYHGVHGVPRSKTP